MRTVDITNVKFINRNADRRKFKGIEKEGEKTCSKCMKSKILSEFGINTKRSDGKKSNCKECGNEYAKNHYAEVGISRVINKEYRKAYYFKENRRIKLICMIGYGGCCQCCGDSRIEMLTIEHIRNKGHELIYGDVRVLMKNLIRLNFPEGYTCLCFGCNFLTRYGTPCEHSKEGIEYYNKNIKPYKYCRQKELDELECKWRENVV